MASSNPDSDPDISSSVLDLPQLYTKPSASLLLFTLASLAIIPASWDPASNAKKTQPKVNEAGIPAYLTSLISSNLAWIESDKEKEAIWEETSARLSERAGRAALSSLSRTFSIPIISRPDETTQQENPHTDEKPPSKIDITLHEPALTADNLGHKTWLASYLLARRLHTLLPQHFPAVLLGPPPRLFHPPPAPRTLRILELGAGTGLAGIAASCIIPSDAHIKLHTHLTDLPPIVANLSQNIKTNSHLYPPTATVTAGSLDWSTGLADPSDPPIYGSFNLILAADSLYSTSHPGWLANMIFLCLEIAKSSRVFLELPIRETEKEDLHAMLRKEMRKNFRILQEGVEEGFDDWESPDGDRMEVKCWWSIWAIGNEEWT